LGAPPHCHHAHRWNSPDGGLGPALVGLLVVQTVARRTGALLLCLVGAATRRELLAATVNPCSDASHFKENTEKVSPFPIVFDMGAML
jgi:hypothetical protein